jgi:hypothetical protein
VKVVSLPLESISRYEADLSDSDTIACAIDPGTWTCMQYEDVHVHLIFFMSLDSTANKWTCVVKKKICALDQ